jgi:hypothetical protein
MLLDTSPSIENDILGTFTEMDSPLDMSYNETIGLRNSSSYRIIRSIREIETTDFQRSMQGLLNLDEIDEDEIDEEDDIVKPSSYAFTEAYKLLNEIRGYFKTAFPYCSSSLETKGGIDLVWDNRFLERRVWVEIPNNEQINGAIFYREKDKSKFISKIDFKRVMRLLLWLNDSQMSIENI